MTQLQLRDAIENDYPAFFRLFAQMQGEHAEQFPEFLRDPKESLLHREYFSSLLQDPAVEMVVAECSGEVAGYVIFLISTGPENVFEKVSTRVHLEQLVIDQAHRQRGFATQLLDYVVRYARDRDISLLSLDVWDFNSKAQRLFEQHGFRAISKTLVRKL